MLYHQQKHTFFTTFAKSALQEEAHRNITITNPKQKEEAS